MYRTGGAAAAQRGDRKPTDRLKVAMLAPPWLSVPPRGYGGIEYLIHFLIDELEHLGAKVELFSTHGTSTTRPSSAVDTPLHSLYDDQFPKIADRLYDAVPVPAAHLLFALNEIAGGDFDIIHDHNGFIGPLAGAFLDPTRFPPMLHTLHGPFTSDAEVAAGLADNRVFYDQFHDASRVFVNGISHAQLRGAPAGLASRMVGVVHNSVSLADYPFCADKADHFLMLARVCRDKGQGEGARLCQRLGHRLMVAGTVQNIESSDDVAAAVSSAGDDGGAGEDLRYFRDEVVPFLEPGRIEYVGNVSGARKFELMGSARALLFPIDWEEPFGLAVIEALACGTPVVAMARGALTEIIEHGVNGFLASSIEEFEQYTLRVDEIDPVACRASVERHFSAPAMARSYLDMYNEVINRDRQQRALPWATADTGDVLLAPSRRVDLPTETVVLR